MKFSTVCILSTLLLVSHISCAEQIDVPTNPWNSPTTLEYDFKTGQNDTSRHWAMHFFSNSEMLIENTANNTKLLMLPSGFIATKGFKMVNLKPLDQPVLSSKLLLSLLNYSLPDGSVTKPHDISFDEENRTIRIQTASSEGQFIAPWKIDGKISPDQNKQKFELKFHSEKRSYNIQFSGFWAKEKPSNIDKNTDLTGWSFVRLTVRQVQQYGKLSNQYIVSPVQEKFATLDQFRHFARQNQQ
ncbi:MAG: hypothetical protein ACWA5R_04120 [bacterium]